MKEKKHMLRIDNLHVTVGNNKILKGVNLTVDEGETAILFGPNGSGKTSLVMTIMGMPEYTVTSGRILFKGRDITHAPSYARARMGIGMSFQRPPTIHGLKTSQLINLCARGRTVDISSMAEAVHFSEQLDRDINDGFSGGEIKRSELLQLMAMQPELLLFDEPESGVDLDNMALIGQVIQSLLHQGAPFSKNEAGVQTPSSLIITHTGYILNYVEADCGYILFDGILQCQENPGLILEHIRQHGYREGIRCLKDQERV